MPRYLVASDGSEYAEELVEGLELLGVTVERLDGFSVLASEELEPVDALVLANPTRQAALEVREAIKSAGGWMAKVPLVLVSGELEPLQNVDGLTLFDDFVVRPAGAGELVCRVRLQSVRKGGEGRAITFGDLVVNLDAHQVLNGGKPVDLTLKEYELLLALVSSPGRAFSRDELLRGIWGYEYLGGTRTVDVHIRRVRSKIEGARQYIETVHGVGYRFVSS